MHSPFQAAKPEKTALYWEAYGGPRSYPKRNANTRFQLGFSLSRASRARQAFQSNSLCPRQENRTIPKEGRNYG